MNIPPWSYSSLSAFTTCPWRYKLTRVTKEVTEPRSEHLVWGEEVHAALEHRIKDGTPLAKRFQKFSEAADTVASWSDAWQVEQKFGLTEELKPTTFFGKDVWCRGVLDLVAINGSRAVCLDWKTGQSEPKADQLRLFAASIFHQHPEVQQVRTGFVRLEVPPMTFHPDNFMQFGRDDLPMIWNHFLPTLKRLERAYAEDRWPKNPSGLCRRYCPVGRSRCEHCGT